MNLSPKDDKGEQQLAADLDALERQLKKDLETLEEELAAELKALLRISGKTSDAA
jgi:hypothetical protein